MGKTLTINETRKCPICGTEFNINSEQKRKVYCDSEKCKLEGHRLSMKKRKEQLDALKSYVDV